jgi:hypothetical protein
MVDSYDWLKPSHMMEGFRAAGEVHGSGAGGFWRGLTPSEQQVAIHYLRRGTHGAASAISVYWDPDPSNDLVGTTNHVGQQVMVNDKTATYHDGTWMPGPGLNAIDTPAGGKAHWGRDFLHSITMITPKGVFALRCPYAVVPDARHMIKMMSSISALS